MTAKLLCNTSICLRLRKLPCFRRYFANTVEATPSGSVRSIQIPPEPPAPLFYQKPPTVLTTIYKFPTLEPLEFANYPSAFLSAPLRKDVLHRAITYEGDSHRFGLARTKTRSEIHGSGKKLRPQKGSGKARLGDNSSPMLRGGAKAHGPKARDFSTDMPKKMYDMAFRIAFSYRYKKGDLVVVDNLSTWKIPDKAYMKEVMTKNEWGRANKASLLITMQRNEKLENALKALDREGRVLTAHEVDCKDLLEMGRIVIELSALKWFREQRCPNSIVRKR